MMPRYGASVDDWTALNVVAGIGAALLPVVSNPTAAIGATSKLKSLGKVPSRYGGTGRLRQVYGIGDWPTKITTTQHIARWQQEPDYGICIRTGPIAGVYALDVDITDAASASKIEAMIGSQFPTRRRSNSQKFLMAFKLAGDLPKRIIKAAHGNIEFLGTGQQFVACGTHISGAQYEWDGGTPEYFPTLGHDDFEQLWSDVEKGFAVAPPEQAAPSKKAEVLATATSSDPVVAALNVIGQAKDGKLYIHCPFADGHTEGAGDQTSTVYFPAHTGGYERGHFDCKHASCSQYSDADFLNAVGYVDAAALEGFDVVKKLNGYDGRFKVLSVDEFANTPRPEWIIKNVLPRAELGVLFGESGSGKSFLALDIAGAIVRGLPWRDHKVAKGRVVYVAAEGTGDFRNRVLAFCRASDIAPSELADMGVIPEAPNIFQKKQALELAHALKSFGKIDVVIIDTVAQTTPGADENSGEDMGAVLAHCKGLHHATGALILLVHHAGKDLTKGARGWSGLRAAADVELEVSRDGDFRCARISKQRGGVDGTEFRFRLSPVLVELDEDGDDVTSCVVDASEQRQHGAAHQQLHGVWERVVMDVVGDFSIAENADIELTALVDEAARRMPANDGRDRRRDSVRRAVAALAQRGVFILRDDRITPT